jgi:hypothetical protein
MIMLIVGTIYILGGDQGNGNLLSTVEVYDTLVGGVLQENDLAFAGASMAAVVVSF